MYTSLGPDAVGIDLPFPEAAELAAETGFDGIQLDLAYLESEGPDAVRRVLDDNDLRIGSASLPVAVDGPESAYESDLESLPETAERMAAAGCTRASTYILSFSDERPYEENFEFLAERLAEPAAVLDDHGIDLGLEFLGPETLREGHEHEFIHDIEGMLELCDAVGENAGLLLDSWHWYTAGETGEELASLEGDDVVDVHVNDAPDLPREEQVDTERRLAGETGVIDIAMFLDSLADIGYEGPVMAEPFSDELSELPPEEAAERTMASMAAVWETAGLTME